MVWNIEGRKIKLKNKSIIKKINQNKNDIIQRNNYKKKNNLELLLDEWMDLGF